MGAVELLVLIAFCAGIAVFLMWATTSHAHVIAFDPSKLDLEAAGDAEVLDYLNAGDKISAIKAYRELSGVSLQDAKNAIEFLALNPRYVFSEKPKRLGRDTPFDTGVREMIRSGRKLDALKIYREFTGASLAEANEEIERIEWEESQRSRQNGHR